ncbi:pheromone processing endoprotease [Coelomomyces lativittatus]|nr:pheromone processing endoprotease [Coelomomyces lativittatus]
MPPKDLAHGTQSAGIVGASENDFCGVGVAPKVRLSGIRLTSNQEGASIARQNEALTYFADKVHVYSSSWGPTDSGNVVDGPDLALQHAWKVAIQKGRQGLGNVYVFAAGNGKLAHDDCNYDGYVNSIYTIAAGAVHAGKEVSGYSEACTAVMISAYSNFGHDDNVTGIVTADLGEKGCTTKFGGTSTSAPMVSGIIALMLQVRPQLTWRDVMGVLVYHSRPIDPFHRTWQSTFGKLRYSRQYGFGVVNAGYLVEGAKAWKMLPEWATYTSEWKFFNSTKRKSDGVSRFILPIPNYSVTRLKQVEQVVLNIELDVQGGAGFLIHTLTSPSKIKSKLTDVRPLDFYTRTLRWNFSSVEFWGETKVEGDWVWSLEIVNASVEVKIGGARLYLVGSKTLPELSSLASSSLAMHGYPFLFLSTWCTSSKGFFFQVVLCILRYGSLPFFFSMVLLM